MKAESVLIIVAIGLALAPVAVAPAFAWSWPIFGFGPGPGAPLAEGPLPCPILTGTFEWALQLPYPARLALPGYSYGIDAFEGDIGFGPALSFG